VKPVVFHSEAQADLDAALAYFEHQREGLGLELEQEVEAAVARLQQNPKIGTPYKATGFRRQVLKRFPFVIYYADLEECLWIAAIAHGKLRPDYWKKRKPD
jgi:toxin ParE1/3/4